MHARAVVRARRRREARRVAKTEERPAGPLWATVLYREGGGYGLVGAYPSLAEALREARTATLRELDRQSFGGEPGYGAAFAAPLEASEGEWLSLGGEPGDWRVAGHASEALRAEAAPPALYVAGRAPGPGGLLDPPPAA